MQNNDTYTIEEMKQQMALLKKKLDEQHIVNEKVLHNVMKKNLYSLNKRGRILFVLGVFVACWSPGYFNLLGFSNWFCAATMIMLLFCAFKTFQYHRSLWRIDFSECNLIDLSEKLTLLKKRYQEWYKKAMCIVIPWFIWLVVEAYYMHIGEYFFFIGGCLLGGIIGGLAGTRINKNIIRRADELLEQIKEYRA